MQCNRQSATFRNDHEARAHADLGDYIAPTSGSNQSRGGRMCCIIEKSFLYISFFCELKNVKADRGISFVSDDTRPREKRLRLGGSEIYRHQHFAMADKSARANRVRNACNFSREFLYYSCARAHHAHIHT